MQTSRMDVDGVDLVLVGITGSKRKTSDSDVSPELELDDDSDNGDQGWGDTPVNKFTKILSSSATKRRKKSKTPSLVRAR